ncbi:hypothetical protein [uncultured Desulfosarcina sp.]|uniref:hypothetical protein n=1 Tax=uncultured Desulfosarcina sp. TaxID=218289 RepID=UPI0029C7D14A|nr:hypothetical protein [uncultured Desulfosarcina sp.]
MRKNRISTSIGISIILIFAIVGCSDTLSRKFYTHHPKSAQDVEKVWGQPTDITELEGGIEKRTYAVQNPYTDLKYRYFLIKDGMVLASGITDTGKKIEQEVHHQTDGFVPSDLSVAFYAKHRTTVTDLDQTWGKPLLVKDAKDGKQFRLYKITAPYADFNFREFILKDGVVVASSLNPKQAFSIDSQQHEYKGIEINEISALYYTRHPMTLETVEATWGKPVFIEKTKKGLEKRTYKLQMPADTAFAFRFFIIDGGMVVSSGVSDTVTVTAN